MTESDREYSYSSIGKDIHRLDALKKLSGQAVYVNDMILPGMLYARVKRSPHAHAKIVSIETSKARSLPGVRAVLTGKELPYKVGLYLVDKDILAKEEVRHYGEAVAAVAAETAEIAKQAIDLIEVEYEVLKPVLDIKEALLPTSALVHPNLGSYSYLSAAFTPIPKTNVANWTKIRKGNVEKAFGESAYIVEGTYENPSVQHVPLECHVAIAQWGIADKVTIWTSAQSPFTVRNLFCKTFSLPLQNVRVIVPNVGGGFGGKAGIHLEPLVACLSRKAGGFPVKFQASREEEFSLLPCRCALTYKIKTGVSSKGKILAQKMELFWDSGAYADYAVNITRSAGYSAAGPYEIPNAWVDSYTIYTNKPYGTAFRGFGHVEFHWGIERHMNQVAKAVGMDALSFRHLNAVRPGSVTLTGETLSPFSGNVLACMDAVASSIGYGKLSAEEKLLEEKGIFRIGKGLALLHKAPAMPTNTSTAAIVKMQGDGTVSVNVGLTEIGQGSTTALAQIVSETLSFPLDRIDVKIEKDTDSDPYDWQTVASKGLVMSGNACIMACKDLLAKGYAVAAQVLKTRPEELSHTRDRVFVKAHPQLQVSWSNLALGYSYPHGESIGGPLIGIGTYIAQGLSNLDKETGQGNPAMNWTFGAHAIVCKVNTQTGEFSVLKVVSAFDVGKVINPGLLRGQMLGGIVQGLGTALCEGYVFDTSGHLLNQNLTDNKIPTAMDLPVIETIAIESEQVEGPFGARGVGEHSMISVAPALGNAIEDAVKVNITRLPIRFEDVWRALHSKKGENHWLAGILSGFCTEQHVQEK
ncbi:aerobic-type carbon monoxide dehydrogenase, large subunit CoxL/CutL-like protein [Sphaerochaeta pleomorpha str. Grapes]|uniref:Aerobic-type carbon monoxide dehydrogenase, large subunit CoxL/CutL-like protein n=1 Tax=Sphaerochaeta pleomorpha (strain ATCC BAA-1885 / DSM 22778 / Grapes) TaxID=158190 RepID=G8QUA3_SPHPG|nr:xanthine dehydrogenase family protein molybdopterin-binding subunit [Sphaerochaeta pleomorpha]AEV28073.1 aerobic-type carbon monoxide dehydrogenase, large subunit CoxL/CutL-like protein [Sphaerochaeta pleomorpha str. Grapes]